MNLSVKDLAERLNFTEKTIYQLIQNETIPCFKSFRIDDQWRFDRREIRTWMEDICQFSLNTAKKVPSSEDEEPAAISEFLMRGGIFRHIQARTEEEAVRKSLKQIEKAIPQLETKNMFASIMARESLCPTSIGNEIALPHPKRFGRFTGFSCIALCFLERPVPFGAFDGEQVDKLFFIFPKSERRFLKIQAKLLRLLKDDLVWSIIRGGSRGEICRVLSRKEAELFGGKN